MEAKKNADVKRVGLNDLLYGGNCPVPKYIAVCPECGDKLHVDAMEWETESGVPTTGGLYVYCKNKEQDSHMYWQSDWQSIINAAEKWCGAVDV